MHPRTQILAVALCGMLGFGCSTKLIVRAIEADQARDSRAAAPEGLVVNRLGTYVIRVKPATSWIEVPQRDEPDPIPLIDPHRLLEVDYCRMPFSNGKLTLNLIKDAQTMSKAGVKGTTPATNVVKAADKRVSTATKLQELLAEPEPTP